MTNFIFIVVSFTGFSAGMIRELIYRYILIHGQSRSLACTEQEQNATFSSARCGREEPDHLSPKLVQYCMGTEMCTGSLLYKFTIPVF